MNDEHIKKKRQKLNRDDAYCTALSSSITVAVKKEEDNVDTGNANENDDNQEESEPTRKMSPSNEDINLALCKIDDTDNNTHNEIKKALRDLLEWGKTQNVIEFNRIVDVFIDGGIQRLLDFIQELHRKQKKKKKDDDDTDDASMIITLVQSSLSVLCGFVDPGDSNESLNSATKIVQILLENDGHSVNLLLSIVDTTEKKLCTTGKNENGDEFDKQQMEILLSVWYILGNIVSITSTRNTVCCDDINTLFPIINSGISTLDVLNEIHPSCINDNDAVSTMVTDLENHVLNAFGNIMKNAEMFHDHNVFVGKNIFPICIRSMKKNLNNNNMKPSWKYEPHIWASFSNFCYECCREKRKFLSKKVDFDTVVPFLIQFMTEDPNYAYTWYAYDLLRKSCDIIGKKTMIKIEGLLKVLGAVADGGNTTVEGEVKTEAIKLLKYVS